MREPDELGLQKGLILKEVKHFHGKPESGLQWYPDDSKSNIRAVRIIRKMNDLLDVLKLLQVDDFLVLGTTKILTDEKEASKVFRCEERTPCPQTNIIQRYNHKIDGGRVYSPTTRYYWQTRITNKPEGVRQ